MLIVVSPETSHRRLLTPTEAAAALDVSAATVRRWLNDGQLEGVRIGSRLRTSPEAIDALVKRAHSEEGEA